MAEELILRESEGEKLKREIRELREKTAALTAERDDLKLRICRELEAEYNRKIGVLELTVLMKRIRVLQLRRLLEALQAVFNRKEQPDFGKEEEKVREETGTYEEDLKSRAEKIRREEAEEDRRRKKRTDWEEKNRKERAGGKDGDPLPEIERISRGEETDSGPSFMERLKSLYRKIVKLLHPDMNPDVTREQQALFRDAVRAYKEEDIDRLQEISDLLDAEIFPQRAGDSPEDLAKLRKIRDGLLAVIAALEAEIQRIKETRPYLYKFFLEDEDAVRERRESLLGLIRELDGQIDVLENRLNEMKKKGGSL